MARCRRLIGRRTVRNKKPVSQLRDGSWSQDQSAQPPQCRSEADSLNPYVKTWVPRETSGPLRACRSSPSSMHTRIPVVQPYRFKNLHLRIVHDSRAAVLSYSIDSTRMRKMQLNPPVRKRCDRNNIAQMRRVSLTSFHPSVSRTRTTALPASETWCAAQENTPSETTRRACLIFASVSLVAV